LQISAAFAAADLPCVPVNVKYAKYDFASDQIQTASVHQDGQASSRDGRST
jgi:hypothetical protein